MKTVLVFQGGGALGAFGAGAWQVLATDPGSRADALIAVAGASIGALNAASVAHHLADEDRGSAALLSLWRDRFTTPSWPFFGALAWPVVPSNGRATDWNGFITGTLLGNRAMFSASWPTWQPLSGLDRLDQPLHDRRAMWRLLEEQFASYASAPHETPMLAAAAVDVMSGELDLFDSDSAELTARHLAASSAIPLLFDPVEIDGRLHWDGEMTRDSLLPMLLQRLLRNGRVARDEPVQLVTIEQFPRQVARRPQSGAEIAYRALNLMQLGKLDVPSIDGIRIARVRRVVREPLPEDGVSGQFDYSPDRIERLIEQGRAAATRMLAAPNDAVAPIDDVAPTRADGRRVPSSADGRRSASRL